MTRVFAIVLTGPWTLGAFGCAACLLGALGCGAGSDSGCDERTPAEDDALEAGLVPLPGNTQWIDAGVAVDSGSFGSWDALFEGHTPCGVVRHGGRFLLYYVGADDYIADPDNIGPAHRSIGVAVSEDGIHWTKPAVNPVITFSASGNPEEGAVSAGVTVDADGTVLAYYGANVATDPTTSQVSADVRLAVSSDGLRFEEIGKVIDHADDSVWGHGDEIHATLAFEHEGTYHVFYVPNGSAQKGMLGYCRGPDRASLSDCGEVKGGRQPVSSFGPSSAARIGPRSRAVFVSNRGTIDVYRVDTTCPSNFGPPVQSYPVGGNAVFLLDDERRTWFMFYDAWSHIGLEVAPAGPRDASPPSAPSGLAATSSRYDRVRLTWKGASDPETGILRYDVHRNGEKIGSTSGRAFSDSTLAERTTYEFAVRAVNLHGVRGSPATCGMLTDADTTTPRIRAVSAVAAGEVTITFDEPVARASATSPSRYLVNGMARVRSASMGDDPRMVVLATSPLEPDAIHTLTVTGILDRATAPNSGTDQRMFTASRVASLIGYWSLDHLEFAGIDLSGAGHRAVVRGAPDPVAGKVAGGIDLSGADYLEIDPGGALEDAIEGSFTVALWARPAGLPLGTDVTNAAYTLFAGGGVRLQYGADRRFVASIPVSHGRVELRSGEFDPGTWHHVAMSVAADQKTLALFVDRSLVAGAPRGYEDGRLRTRWESPSFRRYYRLCRVGVNDPLFAYESDYFRGALDEIRIYRRALSPDELRQLP